MGWGLGVGSVYSGIMGGTVMGYWRGRNVDERWILREDSGAIRLY
jgi:hypothetical protein